MIKKIINFKFAVRNYQKGMTYVELIVVLGIFFVMTAVVLFNYKEFQAKVDIKNLASDIALKIVEAQKSSLSGKWNSAAGANWKPAYGVYINKTVDSKSFVYFADLNNDWLYQDLDCIGECVEKISITKGNSVSDIKAYSPDGNFATINDVGIVFKRPDSSMIATSNGIILVNLSYIQITIISPKSISAKINIYASGRIQVN